VSKAMMINGSSSSSSVFRFRLRSAAGKMLTPADSPALNSTAAAAEEGQDE
jgi:hypothetical protein